MPGLLGPSPLLRLQSDERLIALTRRGQPAAFEVLCARYQSRLLAFCRHMLASREDAEDVLQEVFAAAYNAVLADERAINVRPWLYRIARNRSLNHLRRVAAIGVDSMDVHFADNGLSTGDRVLRRESFRELIADVHELPETQRTALLLREIDALSYEQIAHAMETTVPSVKSLLVRARISLAEAAEARKLSCEQVRLELGEAAEGVTKLTTPARRHVRGCERCTFFKKQLRENNRALAAILPVGPLLLVKKLLLAKLGSTASAGGAHVAGGAGATVGAGAGATVGAGAAAGVGAGSAGFTGGLLTAGAGALATKAVAGLAAAAIVTAGAVAADHTIHHPHHALTASTHSAPVARYAPEPVVVRAEPQPLSYAAHVRTEASVAAHRASAHKAAKHTPVTAPATLTAASATPATPVAVPPAVKPATTPPPVQVTEVTTETTQLPPTATSGTQAPATPATPASPPASTTPPSSPPPNLPTAEPVTPVSTPTPPPVATSPPASAEHVTTEVGAGAPSTSQSAQDSGVQVTPVATAHRRMLEPRSRRAASRR
jgi:RNA polymerase sigma factor (sigma-70 family)